MKIRNTILLCCLSFVSINLFAVSSYHIQPLSHTENVDSSNHAKKLVLDAVRVSDIGNCTHLIEWITPAEKDCYSFVIMKSMDKINYTSIGSVLGSGTTNQSKLYEFVDGNANPNNYYRIDQFDYKGKMISSEILMATSSCGKGNTSTVIEEIYANPMKADELSIRIFQNESTAEKIRLTDQFGKTIMEKNVKLNQGKNILLLNVSKITSGTYFIKIGSESEKFAL